MGKPTYEELSKDIEIEYNDKGNSGVERLLKNIYGEDKGYALFGVWTSFKRLIDIEWLND